ncbi:MAG TPA: 4-hydroxy-tetrahydrodipicolinate synthase [Armatimonadota bacterium]|nr:4-hydroxy-tetrahydrodipicolinate synthase [Armatimonadota bacterium]
MKFEGAYTAIVTPMLSDGTFDYEGFQKNVEFQISQGITGIVPAGTTGESPTLGWDDHAAVIDKCVEFAGGRCQIIAGTGSNSTEEALMRTTHAAQAGVKAVLMVDCYYNGPSSLELRDDYYSAIADLVPEVSIIPYIIPGRTATALAVEDLAILYARHPQISAVKEATGDLERMKLTRKLCGDEFSILSGDDDLTYKMITDPEIAADGVISVMSNITPAAIEEMVSAARSGDTTKAEKLQNALSPLFGVVTVKVENDRLLPDGRTVKVMDKYRNPLAVKTLMNSLGMPSGPTRPPLGKMTKLGVDTVRQAVKAVWEKNPEILNPIAEFYGIDIEKQISDDNVWQELAHP